MNNISIFSLVGGEDIIFCVIFSIFLKVKLCEQQTFFMPWKI